MSLFSLVTGSTLLTSIGLSPRLEAAKLEDQLDERLEELAANDYGLCPLRDESFQWAFEKLNYQIAAHDEVQGNLLNRVRNESKLTKDAYKALYRSAVAFANKKAGDADLGKRQREETAETLTNELDQLVEERRRLEVHIELFERRLEDQLKIDEEKQRNELLVEQKANEQLEKLCEVLRIRFGEPDPKEVAKEAERKAAEEERLRKEAEAEAAAAAEEGKEQTGDAAAAAGQGHTQPQA